MVEDKKTKHILYCAEIRVGCKKTKELYERPMMLVGIYLIMHTEVKWRAFYQTSALLFACIYVRPQAQQNTLISN